MIRAVAAAAVAVVLVVSATLAALAGVQPPQAGATVGFAASPLALREIPPLYLRLYQQAGQRYGIDWAILAGIGSVETDHGRSHAAGVHSGVNFAGCCAGPMQFSVIGHPSTWDTYGAGGSVYDPAAAIPAAARYLKASGAPADYHAAIFAYNHAEWYVAAVMAKADAYRGAAQGLATAAPGLDPGALATVLRSPRVTLTAVQRSDLRTGLIDPRVISILAFIASRHSIIVTALRSDHSLLTVGGSVSNHSAGRAVDIGAVDGQRCSERFGAVDWRSACSRLALELAHVTGPLRSTELIWCGDPDGPSDPRGFARPDHCDHVHVGWDG